MGTLLRNIVAVLLSIGLAVPASADIYPSGLSRTRETRMIRRPATAVAATVDRIVGTNGRIPNAAITSSVLANKREYQGRMPFLMGGDVSEFALAFDNWGLNPSPVDNSGTDTISDLWIAVEGGAARRMTFGGSTSLVMAGNAARQLSDRLRPGDFGFSGEIPRGTKFWVCLRGVIGAGGNLWAGTLIKTPGGSFSYFDPATAIGSNGANCGTAAPPAQPGQNSISFARGFSAVIGRFTTANVPSIVAIGDSILDGTSDGTNPIPVVTGNGYLNRAALDADGANPIAMMNMTRSSASTANFLGGTRPDYWTPYLQYANIVVDELGSNDFGLSAPAGRAASFRTSIGQMWALYRAAGVQRIMRTTFQPRITGGSGTSAAEQTSAGGWGNGGERDAINATFAGDLQAGTIDALVGFNPVWEDGNSGKWVTNITSNYATTDGMHPSAALHGFAAVILRAAILGATITG